MSVIDRPLIQRPGDNDKIRSQRVVWACGISHKPVVCAPNGVAGAPTMRVTAASSSAPSSWRKGRGPFTLD